jgi:hypothetical protein
MFKNNWYREVYIMDNLTMAQLLFGQIDKTPADYEALYPARNLGEGAKVSKTTEAQNDKLQFIINDLTDFAEKVKVNIELD